MAMQSNKVQLTGSIPQLKRTSKMQSVVGNGSVVQISQVKKTYPITADNIIVGHIVNNNYGTSTNLYMNGDSGTQKRRALIRADGLTGLNPTLVKSAKLYMYDVNTTPTTRSAVGTFGIYPLVASNKDWVEGTQNGATALTGESTWANRQHPGTGWTGGAGIFPGGVGSKMGALTSTPGYTGVISTDLDVNIFKSSLADNAGFLIMPDDDTTNTKALGVASKDNATASQRPYIEVTFDLNAKWIVFQASDVGAKVVDGDALDGSVGIAISTNGLVLPVSDTETYAIFAPTGVTVNWFTMG
jgi:hypothetical protein